MTVSAMQDLSLDDIMARIQEEVARNRIGKEKDPYEVSEIQTIPETVKECSEPATGPGTDRHLNNFLHLRDRDLIDAAYRQILGRCPDPDGYAHYLARLRDGGMTRIECIGRIRFSKEGRRRNVRIKGLLPRYLMQLVYRVPVLGYLARIGTAIASLPKILKQIERIENDGERRNAELKSIREAKADKSEIRQFMSQNALKLEKLQQDKVDDAEFRRIVEQIRQTAAEKEEINRVVCQLVDHKRNILDQERRLRQFLETVKQNVSDETPETGIKKVVDQKDHLLDAFYVSFEDRFRGSREAIKERQKIYLPYLAGENEEKKFPVIDLGCGRGEWLELLSQQGYVAQGVDSNRVMAAECRELGLAVEAADAFAYLSRLQNESVCALTGFHFIEHLELDEIISLMDEAFRILIPNGRIIFETPNPRNILVGSGDFYRDPSHTKPLFPDTLKFICEQRGFTDVNTYFIEKSDGAETLVNTNAYRFRRIEDYMAVSRDFALIGCK